MNKAIICGRLTRDPDVRWSQGQDQKCTARYTLAVDRRIRNPQEGQQTADFISCIAFGKSAEFVEKYLRQGMKMLVTGRIATGSYTNRDGVKVYTTDVIIEEQEFAESKTAQSGGMNTTPTQAAAAAAGDNDFMPIPDDLGDEGLPFA